MTPPSTLAFTVKDFEIQLADGTNFSCFAETLANVANVRLAEMLRGGVELSGSRFNDVWELSETICGKPLPGHTHKCFAINFEEIKRECVEHEPALDDWTVKKGKWIGECKHCNKKLTAKWSVADE